MKRPAIRECWPGVVTGQRNISRSTGTLLSSNSLYYSDLFPHQRLVLDTMRLVRVRTLPPLQVLDVRPVYPLGPQHLQIAPDCNEVGIEMFRSATRRTSEA